jgi:hypothetical protein
MPENEIWYRGRAIFSRHGARRRQRDGTASFCFRDDGQWLAGQEDLHQSQSIRSWSSQTDPTGQNTIGLHVGNGNFFAAVEDANRARSL